MAMTAVALSRILRPICLLLPKDITYRTVYLLDERVLEFYKIEQSCLLSLLAKLQY